MTGCSEWELIGSLIFFMTDYTGGRNKSQGIKAKNVEITLGNALVPTAPYWTSFSRVPGPDKQ
jgi:hypothetical protein